MLTKPLALFVTLLLIAFSSLASTRADIGWQQIEQGAMLIDVRTAEEFKQQHIKGAINQPLNNINFAFNDIDKNQPIVVYCRSGNRSGQAKRILTSLGFKNVHNAGGLSELLQAK
ncbi:rhodanese-like domain-containing protein [Vibrio sp. TH_r3]|uniref:rhodanese-like domain-containing protein n=1 Tax=Vibrio sp. TH_r3 TaxID=3082084 RepID=UPI0029555296|nr:rhodanese-like domain-containing protein [Vibrio sp. TH_r3]MDV7103783.1 rhodanese-like domain-containing protein [Vibrio sp. TH_r3]